MGITVENFPSSRLPLQHTLLQWYHLLSIDSAHSSLLNDIISIMVKEIKSLWEPSCIPMKYYCGCLEVLKQCVNRWTRAKKATTADLAFQNELNTLIDHHSVNCQTLLLLKVTMKKDDHANGDIDCEFFKRQLKHSQSTSMSKIIKSVLAQSIHIREEKAEKPLAYFQSLNHQWLYNSWI